MSREEIVKKINKQKEQNTINQKQQHIALIQETKKMIPAIVDIMERRAINCAKNNTNIVTRGIFKKRKFVRAIIRSRSYLDDTPQINFTKIKNTPEIDSALISAIIARGFENVHISRNEGLYIEAWLDIT